MVYPVSQPNSEPVTDHGPVDNGHSPFRCVGLELLTCDEWQRVGAELRLSTRELELTQHIFLGKKLQAIAGDMKLSLGTVKTYCQRIYRKLRITDQRELILVVFETYLSLRTRTHAVAR